MILKNLEVTGDERQLKELRLTADAAGAALSAIDNVRDLNADDRYRALFKFAITRTHIETVSSDPSELVYMHGPISSEETATYLKCPSDQINLAGLADLNRQLVGFRHKLYKTMWGDRTTYDGIGPVVLDYKNQLLAPEES